MQAEFILNGDSGVKLLLSPDTPSEEELLKALCKQENEIVEARAGVTVLNKVHRNAILITSKHMKKIMDQSTTSEEPEKM